MILAGPPGPLIDAICASLAAAAGDALAIVHEGTGTITSERPHRLHVAMLPNAADCVDADRLLLAADDAEASFARLCRSGFGPLEALRQLTACNAVLGSLAATGLPVLTSVTPVDIAAILHRLGLADSTAHAMASPAPPDPPPGAAALAMLSTVLPKGLTFARDLIRQPLVWPLACLFSGDRPNEMAPEWVELAGPSRVLVFGPYFHLPPGTWRLRTRLRFSAACAGTWFAAELHGSTRYGRCRFVAGPEGLFAADFTAVVPSPDEPLELRLVLERGAIDGEISLLDVTLTPIDALERDRLRPMGRKA